MNRKQHYGAVVIGTSFGGLKVLKVILAQLPANFSLPIIITQHISSESEGYWISLLDSICQLPVKEADEKEQLKSGVVYIAPPNYHLLIEPDETLSLCVHHRVNYARPSIDVLFESAAQAYHEKLIGILLTGANKDGAKGMKIISKFGGFTIVQSPTTAEAPFMPLAALGCMTPDLIGNPLQISNFLKQLNHKHPVS